MQKASFFPYNWHIDESQEEFTSIRVYGLNKKNENVCVRVDDFTPYVYIELPTSRVRWTATKAQILGDKLDSLMGRQKPVKKALTWKKKLYGAHINPDTGERKLYPYLFCSFYNIKDLTVLGYRLKGSVHVVGLGSLKLKIHESDANPILQMTCCRKLPTAGWVKFQGRKIREDEMDTLCDHEYQVKYKHLAPLDCNIVPRPKIMGFDIEVNSWNPSAMPVATDSRNKVFQISCVMAREGDGPDDYDKYILSLGDPDEKIVGYDVIVYTYPTEAELLTGFTELVREENPNIITGYNILGFDIPYMIARAKNTFCLTDFSKQGFHKYAKAVEKTIKWSSSAYKNQEFQFLDAEGRVYVDLLPLVRRDFKFNNYKLKTISTYFLGQTKDPLSVKGIFKCYRIGTKKNKKGEYGKKARRAMGLVARYCVQDSVLVVRLMDKLKTWVGLTEMAKTCQVPIFTLYTQGQQIKVYSQMYKYCMFQNIVVEKDAYTVAENERYVGAKVFLPIPGKYKMVVPFDFASLYPTTIIAYNIDYHTWVPDDSSIPDHKCHVMEWEDHQACQHDPKVQRKIVLTEYLATERAKIKAMRDRRNKCLDKLRRKNMMIEINKEVEKLKPYTLERAELTKTISKITMCEKRRYRFLKEPKGVMPTILQNLLDARKHTRKVDMARVKKEIKSLEDSKEDNTDLIVAQKTLLDVLNKRQLSYKVSANSMYGITGTRRGYLPFMPAAMCTTYMGRKNITRVAEELTHNHKGRLIYGDTDCVSPYTPLLILENDKMSYKMMEEISDGKWVKTVTGKEMSQAKPGTKIWSDKGFTDIVHVIRHAVEKPMIRVLTHTGVVICSLDHSLLWENGKAALGSEISIGDKLCQRKLPVPDDTPPEPVYPNRLTAEKIRDYVISDTVYEGLSASLAFVWGVFFADGSCGSYKQKNGIRNIWTITKGDNLLLERCLDILTTYEPSLDFKILDTMKSSKANKLVPKQKSRKKEHRGTIKILVEKYRKLFYNDKKYKIVPDIILNAPYKIREAFFMGYYAGDGSKKDPALTITNKGEIGTAGMFFLMRSLGYKVSINTRGDKPDVYKITGSTPSKKFRYESNAVKKIDDYTNEFDYIYDIETANHHFAAGIGEMVVHNSNYIQFPHLNNATETWDYAIDVADKITKLFPPPIQLEFEEEIYAFFLILSKKRYMYRKCLRDGVVDDKIGKKGVLLARRDNSKFVRDVYEGAVSMIASHKDCSDILYFVLDQINQMCSGSKPYTDFIITKSVGDHGGLLAKPIKDKPGKAMVGDYTVPLLSRDKEERDDQMKKKKADSPQDFYLLCLPAQVQLAERMRRRGKRVDPGTRLEYVVTNPDQHTAKQYEKIESADYMARHRNIIRLDYMYYLKALVNPLDQVLDVSFKDEKTFRPGFTMRQYKYRWKVRSKLIHEIQALSAPRLVFK